VKTGLIALIGAFILATQANADIFGGVEFPSGASSFADAVVSYNPVIKSGEPTAPFRDSSQALGVPDFTDALPGDHFVSLGDGCSITLRFTDNSLTGSGTPADDLWIFEIGPDVEDTFVEISKDGTTWSPVGKVFGAISGVDIDAFGFGTGDFFSYVRLTDDGAEGGQTGATVGADIDSVGAIASAPPVASPDAGSTGVLMMIGSGLLALCHRRR